MKAIVLTASFYYILHKLLTSSSILTVHSIQFSPESSCYILLTLILLFCNWGLEARKWQVLVSPFEKISWLQSFQSVLAGVTISIFTPNRVGEFTGRIFFLKKMDKVTASLRSVFGSFIQLVITLVIGCIAMVLYIQQEYNDRLPLQSFLDPEKKWSIIVVVLILVAAIFAVLRFPYFAKWKHHFLSFFQIPRKQFFQIIVLSAIRYFVFATQFYFVLVALGMNIEFTSAFVLIAITFLITSVIPTFALTEIVVRSAVAVSVFAAIDAEPEVAAAASFLIWFINLAIPAVLGSLFIGKLQFFKA